MTSDIMTWSSWLTPESLWPRWDQVRWCSSMCGPQTWLSTEALSKLPISSSCVEWVGLSLGNAARQLSPLLGAHYLVSTPRCSLLRATSCRLEVKKRERPTSAFRHVSQSCGSFLGTWEPIVTSHVRFSSYNLRKEGDLEPTLTWTTWTSKGWTWWTLWAPTLAELPQQIFSEIFAKWRHCAQVNKLATVFEPTTSA